MRDDDPIPRRRLICIGISLYISYHYQSSSNKFEDYRGFNTSETELSKKVSCCSLQKNKQQRVKNVVVNFCTNSVGFLCPNKKVKISKNKYCAQR